MEGSRPASTVAPGGAEEVWSGCGSRPAEGDRAGSGVPGSEDKAGAEVCVSLIPVGPPWVAIGLRVALVGWSVCLRS